jgi:hypothetical protein
MTRSEFEAGFKALVQSQGRSTNNVGCHACERCERCTDSTFCVDGKNLARCQYCTSCVDCTNCSQCQRCTSCLNCTQCIESERCTGSAYLVRCIGSSGCTYCFGCVGLVKRDFHILNEPYDRAAYFEIVKSLSRELRIPFG